MQENIILDENEQNNGYQILVVGITWDSKSTKSYRTKKEIKISDLPSQFTLEVPENVLNQANKKNNVFNDIIEDYTYRTLTKIFGHEVLHCQIWLPLENVK